MLTGPLDYICSGRLIVSSTAFARKGVSVDRALRVLMQLAVHYNDGTAECYPGVTLLAQRLHLSKSRVYEALDALEQAGLITRESRAAARGPQSSPNYRFPWYSDGPARTGRSLDGPAAAETDGPARWSRQMVPPDGPAGQEMNGTERNGEDSTHGGRHAPGNPTDKPCRKCGDEREQRERARRAAPANPPSVADAFALSYCDCCGEPAGRHLRTCEVP